MIPFIESAVPGEHSSANVLFPESTLIIERLLKVLFDNTDIMAALSSLNEIGTVRETFVASMLAPGHTLNEPETGDLLVDEKHMFEIEGKNKQYSQIANLPDSYVIVDNT